MSRTVRHARVRLLWCNGLIDPVRLIEEATDAAQLARQRYIDDPAVSATSVITLNAVATAHAANEYMMAVTELLPEDYEPCWQRCHPGPAVVWTAPSPRFPGATRRAPNAHPPGDSAPATRGGYRPANAVVTRTQRIGSRISTPLCATEELSTRSARRDG